MIDRLLRSLPTFKGKQRFARFLLRRKIDQLENLKVVGKKGYSFFLPNVKENIGFEIWINGVYEEHTVKFISERLNPGGIFLDIGANIGAIGIPVALLRKDVEVVCVEAAPWIFEYLQKNAYENNVSIKLLNKAVSDQEDKEVSFFSPANKFGKGSLAPVFTQDAVKVMTTTLDDIALQMKGRSIGLIKMDIEGFESQAFRGGSKLLREDDAPDILFEFVDWAEELAGARKGQAQQVLYDFGYSIFRFDRGLILPKLTSPINQGSHMFFATKKPMRK